MGFVLQFDRLSVVRAPAFLTLFSFHRSRNNRFATPSKISPSPFKSFESLFHRFVYANTIASGKDPNWIWTRGWSVKDRWTPRIGQLNGELGYRLFCVKAREREKERKKRRQKEGRKRRREGGGKTSLSKRGE